MKRGQAAMEFIMTYGFAMLGVAIVIGALSVFGVTNYDRFLPANCDFPLDVSCTDEPIIEENKVAFSMRNNMQYDILISPEQTPVTVQNDPSGGYMTGMVIVTKRNDGTEVRCEPSPLKDIKGRPAFEAEPCLVKRGDPFSVILTPANELTEGNRIRTETGFTYVSTKTDHALVTSGTLTGRVS
ncbi:MAG: hypothetical protein ABIH34_07375 [Nanoarchaeota archaeon]